jgi:thiamine-phosphate pyrophosphorylase
MKFIEVIRRIKGMKDKEYCPACGHKLIDKHIEGRQRLFCRSCELPVYENPIPATAAVLIDEQEEVLLVKRNVEPKRGHWCLPGGYIELYETPEHGCLREVKEETGLDTEILRWEGNILGDSLLYKSIIVMGYSLKNPKGVPVAGDDCDEVRYFKIDRMPRLAFRSHRQIFQSAIKNRRHPDPASAMPHFQPRMVKQLGAYVITSGDHVDLARRACKAGARILQYRDKTSDRGDMLKTAVQIREITRKYNTLFIVNDYIDLALLAGADGVHLGQEDIPIEEARKITPPGFIIGLSTHSLEQAKDAERRGADYIGSGPVYATPTKAHYVPIGIETLEQVIRTVDLPVVAIGGLNPGNIDKLRELGAINFAMVRAFQEQTGDVVREINALLA